MNTASILLSKNVNWQAVCRWVYGIVIVCLCACVHLQRCCRGSRLADTSRRRWRPRRSSAMRRRSRTAGCRSPPGRGAPSRCKSLWPGSARALQHTQPDRRVGLGDKHTNTIHQCTRLCRRPWSSPVQFSLAPFVHVIANASKFVAWNSNSVQQCQWCNLGMNIYFKCKFYIIKTWLI